jgi:Domain of unknown function (DUF3362)
MQSAKSFHLATCVDNTAIEPFTKQEVYIARTLRDRKMQRALLQFFKPENYFEVRQALIEAGRTDLIGGGCDALIPASPPKAAVEARRRQANRAVEGDHHHAVANPTRGERGAGPVEPKGYRPQRKTQQRRHGDG